MNFPRVIYVREDGESLLVIGDGNVMAMDADDGDRVAIYERKDIRVYAVNPRLEPITAKKRC